jgi:formiminotetrahydrofolate cyclodeaminase
LIAYNIFLNTPNVNIAKSIAKAVRFSSGGMRFVKASGFLVRGLAQVSMNLTDFQQTPLHRVFEFVKREAARFGAVPISSEVVGLIPKQAIEQAAEWFLQLENFDSSLILENRLAAIVSGKVAVGGLRSGIEPFIDQLAAPTAAPGGGSAAAAGGAMAAGLASMVASMSRGKKAHAQYEPLLSEELGRLSHLREALKAAIDEDAEAYSEVTKAYKSAKEAVDGQSRINSALQQAAEVPLSVAERSAEVERIAESLKPITNPNMASDLTTAIALARAAVSGAIANVEINLDSIMSPSAVSDEFIMRARSRLQALKVNAAFVSGM